jgi:hypothetical protein
MGYKNPTKQKEFQREWFAQKRATFLSDKKCRSCKATKNLIISGGQHMGWSIADPKVRKERMKGVRILCARCLGKVGTLGNSIKRKKELAQKRVSLQAKAKLLGII